jgi:hypothetical protein
MGVLQVTLLLGATLQAAPSQDPAAVVRQAVAAVEGDSANALERRWSRAYTRNATDRIAALGLATLAQLTFRDSIAHQYYNAVLNGGRSDRSAGYASLGRSLMIADRQRWPSADSALHVALTTARAVRDSSLLAEALALQARIRVNTLGPDSALNILTQAEAVLPARDLRWPRLYGGLRRVRAVLGDARGL